MSSDQPLPLSTTAPAIAITPRALIHVGILVCALAPILATSGLFIIDLPNHIFRSELIADLVGGKGSTFYDFRPVLLPNMPIDAVALVTRGFLDGEQATVLTAAIACAAFYLSIVYWRCSAGRTTSVWMCLLIVLVLFSRPLYLGLINYVLALGIMNVCLARLERNEHKPAPGFCVVQTVLVVLMYMCSVFPLVIYFSWSLGTVLFDAHREKYRNLPALIRRNAVLHVPPALAVLALVLISNPMPPGDAGVLWRFEKKWENFFTLGAIGNMPYEFVFPVIILLALGIRFFSGALRLSRRQLAGLAALLVCLLVVPSRVHSATLIDMRMVMAIAGIVLATADEARSGLRAAWDALAKSLIAGLVAARALSFAVLWIPMNAMAVPYGELARLVPERSAVAFIYEARSSQERQRDLIADWLAFARSGGRTPIWDKIYIYGDFWHLHMYYFRGRDVYLSNLFQNFFARTKPDQPIGFSETPWTTDVALEQIAKAPFDYVLSHVDLSGMRAGEKRLCLVATRGQVKLYRVVAPEGAVPDCPAPR